MLGSRMPGSFDHWPNAPARSGRALRPAIRSNMPARLGFAMDYRVTADDKERVAMLAVVEKNGLKLFNAEELARLRELLEKKDYSHSKKAARSKARLLRKIDMAIYDREKQKI